MGSLRPRLEEKEESLQKIEDNIQDETEFKLSKGTGGSPWSYILFSKSQAPAWLQRDFILNGYRVQIPYSSCVASFFGIHNETGNVWTHFIGLIFFIGLMMSVYMDEELKVMMDLIRNLQIQPLVENNDVLLGKGDLAMLLLFFLSTQICFLFSTAYHLFKCHSKDACKHFARFDYIGISVFISGCLISTIYFGFYCHPNLQRFYVSTCIVFCIFTTLIANLPLFLTPAYRIYRLIAFTGHVSFSVVPLVHWTIAEGVGSVVVQNTLWRVLVSLLLIGLGFGFYVSKVPERFWPGKFDYIFHSHQIWHVLCVMAAGWQYKTIIYFITLIAETKCGKLT